MEIRLLPNLILLTGLLFCGNAQAQAIKTFPLDDHTVYHLKVGMKKVTTIVFPQVITDIESSGVSADPKVKADILMSHPPGERYLSVRAEKDDAHATLNVICGRSVYVLELDADKEPFQSVHFYPVDQPAVVGTNNVTDHATSPNHLLGLLDKAKAFPLLSEQYPEMVSQIDHAEPLTTTLYRGYDVILSRVFRFDQEDALVFQLELVNHTDQTLTYLPQSLGVRVGPIVYWSALSDASGIMPPGTKDSTGQFSPSHSIAWFVICGSFPLFDHVRSNLMAQDSVMKGAPCNTIKSSCCRSPSITRGGSSPAKKSPSCAM